MLFRSAVSPTFFNNTYRKSRVNFHDNSYSLFAFNPGWEKSGFEHLSRTVLSRFDADYKDNLKTLLLLFFTNILDCSQPDCGLRCRPFEVTCFFYRWQRGGGGGGVNLVVCSSGRSWPSWRHEERVAQLRGVFENGAVVISKYHF